MQPKNVSEDRRADLERRLAEVRGRISAACAAAGRDPSEVSLLAVTKTIPAADVAVLIDLGLDAFGENRAQEAAAKAGEIIVLRPAAVPRWHFVGNLQRNKARVVVPWVTRLETVDSVRLADAVDAATRRSHDEGLRAKPVLPVLIQYSVDGDPARGGVPDDALLELASHVAGLPGLELQGLLAVAPLGSDPEEAFAAIAAAAARLRAEHPAATELSAGMSGDMDVAIRHGSTVVRVGTALVGERAITSR
ncbi:MAG: YggS family pyridoxal phosphate-dependent enzyme [Pseudonocardia sp.]|nr:YggS family pyridoxal phosphate-dependent enzyme [Pseudonocardia sp.]